MFNSRRALVAALAICLSTITARAQINPGHLTGTVKDAQGAVLPGVTVTATSPALLGAQSVTTESGGEYRFPSLPAGTYTLTFELAGFQQQKRENIVLATGQTLTIDPTLQLASLQEAITVTGESPVVDKQSTAVGYVQTTAQLYGRPDVDGPLGRARARPRASACKAWTSAAATSSSQVTKHSAWSIRRAS